MAFTVGQTITSVSPSVKGAVTGYDVQPALPTGLLLDPNSGAITGKPTAITPASIYTFTARNQDGSTSATASIAINDSKPVLDYSANTYAYATAVEAQSTVPVNSGGVVTTWSVSPALPAGLTLDTSNGSITGTPTGVAAAKDYTITATNSGGSASTTRSISVVDGTLLDLGHAYAINVLRETASRTLSLDSTGHWVLWNTSTHAQLASGDSHYGPPADRSLRLDPTGELKGSVFALQTSSGLDLRSVADGHLLTSVTTSIGIWSLSSDGTYVVVGNNTGLEVWDTTSGQKIVARPGDYSLAYVVAASAELRIVSPVAGTSVVETLALPSGVDSVSGPFQGLFLAWFADGEGFLTTVARSAYVYSRNASQLALVALASNEQLQGGTGSWFYTTSSVDSIPQSVNLYKVGQSAAVASYQLGSALFQAGTTLLGFVNSAGSAVSVVDLGGSAPVKTDQTIPANFRAGAFGASSSTHWVLADNQYGLLVDSSSTPSYFDYGAPAALAAGGSRVALATHEGTILIFDTATRMIEATINLPAVKLALSSDGATLVAKRDSLGELLDVFSLPATTSVYTWPGATDFMLSGSGTMLGQVESSPGSTLLQVTPTTGGSASLSTMTGSALALSFDGTHAAVSLGSLDRDFGVNLYSNGSLSAALSGWLLGWLDNDHVIVNAYMNVHGTNIMEYAGCGIYDITGHVSGPCKLPELIQGQMQPLTPDSIYSPNNNSIYTVSTGLATWSSGDSSRGLGSVAGDQVAFVSGARLLLLPH